MSYTRYLVEASDTGTGWISGASSGAWREKLSRSIKKPDISRSEIWTERLTINQSINNGVGDCERRLVHQSEKLASTLNS
jgi:hypothetical protein